MSQHFGRPFRNFFRRGIDCPRFGKFVIPPLGPAGIQIGAAVPLTRTDREGEYVGGVRFKAWNPPSALHPTIGVHAPLVLDVFERLGTETIASFGAVLAPVHHRAQPPLRGYATTDSLRAMLRRRQISSGRYEGPTGITTVLLAAARDRGAPVRTARLRAAPGRPSEPDGARCVGARSRAAAIGSWFR